MLAVTRPRPIHRGAGIALAFVSATAFFTGASLLLIEIDAGVPRILVGIAAAVAVLLVAQRAGIAYAVPCAMAGLLALDWYEIPPVHDDAFPDTANLLDLLFFLAVAVLVGELAGFYTRRAVAAEQARAGISDEQAAVRRVAMLVAADASPSAAYEAVARELGQVLEVDSTTIARYEPDGTGTTLGAWSREGAPAVPTGASWSVRGDSIVGRVARTRAPARISDYTGLEGELVPRLRASGITASVGTPIFVGKRLWGVVVASKHGGRALPRLLEARLAGLTESVVTAISNAESREQLARLADEQATLGRLATTVARGVEPEELLPAVAAEAGRVLEAEGAAAVRVDGDVLASWGARVDGVCRLVSHVAAAGRPARGESGAVAAPVFADGRVWGALVVVSRRLPLGDDAEERLARFAELIATAVANARARAEVSRLIDEQSALRRVATLVAGEPSAEVLYEATIAEVVGLMGVGEAGIVTFARDGAARLVAGRPMTGSAAVIEEAGRTGAVARADVADGPSVVAAPIAVEGAVWGALVAGTAQGPRVPATSEARVAQFGELVATAMANIRTREELAASRARIVAATDAERARVVRDLHDGAQQRLVHTFVTLKLARRAVGDDLQAGALLDEALVQAEAATAELRELAHGILPSVLTRGGLPAGARALASRTPVPVELALDVGRLDPPIEASAYFVVAEALTNIAKHAGATRAWVAARVEDDMVVVEVRDDGRGGARADGSGLVGLADRLATLDGRLWVSDRDGGGTVLRATIPLVPSSETAGAPGT